MMSHKKAGTNSRAQDQSKIRENYTNEEGTRDLKVRTKVYQVFLKPRWGKKKSAEKRGNVRTN